jgi:FkbH-like protein
MVTSLKKCLVWDLDNTLWDGVCLEGIVKVKPEVIETIKKLDSRGILHSIASRGDKDLAFSILEQNNLQDFFLVPQINWLPKSQSIIKISSELNLSLDTIAFIDDDKFEREQVSFMLPDVLTIEAENAKYLPECSEFSPIEISKEALVRRTLYQAELNRKRAEQDYISRKDFLISCGMKLKIRAMNENDIPRVLELMTRTHQLNTTGLLMNKNELTNILVNSSGNLNIMVAELVDKFGSYGIIGVAMFESNEQMWRLKYLAISCRVMGRGIGKAILLKLVQTAVKEKFLKIEAEFCNTGRNKMMRALYQMSGFIIKKNKEESATIIFQADKKNLANIPEWVEVL